MNIKMSRLTVLMTVILLFSALTGAASAAPLAPVEGAGGALPALFSEPSPATMRLAPKLPAELGEGRARLVEVNAAALEAAQPGARLSLNLFEDVQLIAVIEHIEAQDDATLWSATIEGEPWGRMFLVLSQGQIAMDVSMPGGQTQARFMGGPLYRIAEVDQSVFPEELPPIEIDLSTALDAALTPDAPQSLSDSAGSIDVLVAYTPAARSAAGGATAMANLITLAVAETNQSYLNSGMSQRINLVKAVETPYTQSGDMGTDLDRAVNPSDGYMDELPGLRNQYGADLVSVIEEVSQYCGISYHMASISSAFAPYAYSMVARVCATGYYSLAHEMGHNMGARHDYYVDNAGSPTTYAHGYVSLAGRWRTIMAYDSQCNAKGYTCTRLPFWSNPQVRYGGAVMGVAGGTRSNCPTNSTSQYACDADNHRLLNESAATAANFRQHVGAPIPPPWQWPHAVMLPIVRR